MDIDHWIPQVTEAYESAGTPFTPEKRAFLLAEISEGGPPRENEVKAEAIDVMTRFFFKRACRGKTFGSLSRIKERFGQSIEENYGLSSGPFINMAKTYWTYKLEVDDLFPEYYNLTLSEVLSKVEFDIAGIFFPTPGPMGISAYQRREIQRQWLLKYAPEIEIERFLSGNPILAADLSREWEMLIANALQFFKQNNFKAAINEAGKAIDLNPSHPKPYNIRGCAYYKLKNYQAALNDFQIAIQLAPTDPRPYYNRALIYMELKENQQMIADMEAAARFGDKDAQDYLRSKAIQERFPSNTFAIIGLCLGITAAFLYFIGIIPILAVTFSGIGLARVKKCGGKGRVQAWIGLILGIVYTFMYMREYGHF